MTELVFDWSAVVYLLGLAAVWGSVTARLKELEKKMEKHNSLVEKVYHMEVTVEEHGYELRRVIKKLDERSTLK